MNTFDFSQEIKNLDGKPLPETEAQLGEDGRTYLIPTGKNSSIASVCINALLQDDKRISGQEKVKRYELARMINDNPLEVTLGIEEIKKIKDLVGAAFPPLVVMGVYQVIDPKPDESSNKSKKG